jgi:glycosyltransferase involved in cell wall biosynthesis
MLNSQRIVVVLPAYHAGKTLEKTYNAIPRDVVDEVILVDDASDDDTVVVARNLGISVFVHPQNLGYGVFDNQMLIQAHARGFRFGEISCPTRYFDEASSINLRRSMVYGLGVIGYSLCYRLWRWHLCHRSFLSASPELRLTARLPGRSGRDGG